MKNSKNAPHYAVTILNDDDHTVAYMCSVIEKVFQTSSLEAFLLAMQVHEYGRARVWSGPKELADLKAEQVRTFGNDYATEYPLGTLVEPL